MKKVLLSASLMMLAGVSFAQVANIKQAKAEADGKNFAKAESLILDATNSPETKSNAEAWHIAGYVQSKINDEENQKMYLRKPYDTTKFYNSVVKMYEFWSKCDELEAVPDAKGKVKFKHRKDNAARMKTDRGNLINGGIHYFNAHKYPEAQKFFGAYVDEVNLKMFEKDNLAATDTLLATIGYYATMAAMNNKDYDAAIKYAAYGAKSKNADEAKNSIQFKAESYKQKEDEAKYTETLIEGMKAFPKEAQFFFGSMVDYYNSKNQPEKAMKLADDMLASNPNDYYNLFIKGYLLQSNKKYEEAISYYKKSIDAKDDFGTAYTCIGNCYEFLAQEYGDKTPTNKYDRKEFKEFFIKAQPFYAQARALNPEDKTLIQALYRVYYNTDNEAKTKEYEALINN